MRTRAKAASLRVLRTERPSLHRAEPVPAPGIALATVLSGEGERWRVRTATGERDVFLDPSVDPLLVEEARCSGGHVLLELCPGRPSLVGVLQTSRALRVDREGVVDAQVARFSVQARSEAVLKTFASFLRLHGGEAELRGVRTLLRAREMAKVLARIIALN